VPKPQVSTTGDHLHAIFREWFHQDYSPGCSCRETVRDMNAHPPEWSVENMRSITKKIRDEINKRKWWGKLVANIPGIKYPVRWIVLEAVRRASRDAGKGV
jgi:hypothetical protein